MEAFFHHRDTLFWSIVVCVIIFKLNLAVFKGFLGWCEVGHVFSMSNLDFRKLFSSISNDLGRNYLISLR